MRLTLLAAALGVVAIGLTACSGSGDSSAANAAGNVLSSTPNASGDAGGTGASAASTPKNVIFFLGDGYGIVPMTAARIYSVGESGDLAIDTLPETAFVKTYSHDAQVTDSAPSMAAYMTGVKMNNEVISMSSVTQAVDATGKAFINGADSTCPAGNGTPVTTLLELAKVAGYRTGVVTTTRVTHATPAATYAHICHRDGENTIAAQLVPGGAGFNAALGDGVDVVLGGGWRHFLPKGAAEGSSRSDSRNLIDELKGAGYQYVNNPGALQAVSATTPKLLGLFNGSHMNFDLDRDPALEPSLADMTGKAMEVLNRQQGKGYFLMVEGGRIDQALHPTQARRALQDAKAFDEAIAFALAKVRETDPTLANTLIVVTADHDHTLVMNGYAALTGPTTDSHPGVLGLMRAYTDPDKPALDADGMPFTTLVFGNGENRIAGDRSAMIALTDSRVFDKDYHQEAAIPMPAGGETHGGGDVFLGAAGMGADGFHGVIDNTEVFSIVRKAMGW